MRHRRASLRGRASLTPSGAAAPPPGKNPLVVRVGEDAERRKNPLQSLPPSLDAKPSALHGVEEGASPVKATSRSVCQRLSDGMHELARRRQIIYPIFFLACALLAVVLLIVDVVELSRKRSLDGYNAYASAVSTATVSVGETCGKSVLSAPMSPVPTPDALHELVDKTRKQKKRDIFMPYVDYAIDALAVPDCEAAIFSLSNLVTRVTDVSLHSRGGDRGVLPNIFSYSWSISWTHMRSTGVLQLSEDAPVTSKRALRGIGVNVMCSPPISTFIQTIFSPLSAPASCDEADMDAILLDTPIRSGLRFPNNARRVLNSLLESNVNSVFSHEGISLFVGHTILYVCIIISSALGVFASVYIIGRQRQFDREQLVTEGDFCTTDQGVGLQDHTLRTLDYYCWKVGCMESIKLEEIGQAPPEIEPRMGSRRRDVEDSDRWREIEWDPETRPSSSSFAAAPDETSDLRLSNPLAMVQSASVQVVERRRRLQSFAMDAAKLRDASQIHLHIHQTVHPMYLLRPFVPDFILTSAHLDQAEVRRLGPSIMKKQTSVVLQKGLDFQETTLLFVSFRAFNRNDSLVRAAQHYLQLEARRTAKEEEGKGRKHHAHQPPPPGASTQHRKHYMSQPESEIPTGEEATMARGEDGASSPFTSQVLGARLMDRFPRAQEDASGANPLATSAHTQPEDSLDDASIEYPLSPCAVGINYVLGCLELAAQAYHGEVVQLGCDGALLQFRPDACRRIVHHFESVAGDAAAHGERAESLTGRGDEGDRVWVDGKPYVLSAPERAVRTAFLLLAKVEHYCNVAQGHLIPLEFLRCPMIVLMEEANLLGRVQFHVSKHYAVLSRCIPLFFPLEQLSAEYGARIVVTGDVRERIEGFSVSRPFSFVHVDDLKYYCYAVQSGARQMWTETDASAALATAATSSFSRTDAAQSSSLLRRSSKDDEASKGAAGELPMNDSRVLRKGLPEFGVCGSVYEVLEVCALDTTSRAYAAYREKEHRGWGRLEEWRFVWSKYEAILLRRNEIRSLLAQRSQRSNRSRDVDRDMGTEMLSSALASPTKGLETSLPSGGFDYGASLPSAPSGLFTAMASNASKMDELDTEANSLIAVLQDCYQELSTFKSVYGLTPQERHSFNKIRTDLTLLLRLFAVKMDDAEEP